MTCVRTKCCVGGDVPKSQMLKHLGEELEICFKSLVGFLDSKRKVNRKNYLDLVVNCMTQVGPLNVNTKELLSLILVSPCWDPGDRG